MQRDLIADRARHTLNLLRCSFQEMVRIALIRRATPMPEEQPLQALAPFEIVLEAELVFFVCELEQVQHLGAGFHAREGRGLGVVHDHGDAAIGIEAQEPLIFLDVGGDINDGGSPLGPIDGG